MGFNVRSMRRERINDLVITFAFSAGISHSIDIIGSFADDVNRIYLGVESGKLQRCLLIGETISR